MKPDVRGEKQDYFETSAARWDDLEPRVQLARAVARAIAAAVPLTRETRAMEYGCGTGLVSAALLAGPTPPGHVVAADNSPAMLDVLHKKVAAGELRDIEPRQLDILCEQPAIGEFLVIYSSMTLHHVEEAELLLARLFPMLQSGGWLALADLVVEDGSFHGDDVSVAYHGFDPDQLARWCCAAGFTEANWQVVHTIEKPDNRGTLRQYPVFLLTCRKP